MADEATVEDEPSPETSTGDEGKRNEKLKKPSLKLPEDSKKRTRILIAVGIVGLIIAFLTLRKLGSSSTSTTTTTPVGYYSTSPGMYTTPYTGQSTTSLANMDAIDTELSQLIAQQQALTAKVTTYTNGHGSGSTTAGASGAPVNGQQFTVATTGPGTFTYGGGVFTDIASYATTVKDIEVGTDVVLRTTSGGTYKVGSVAALTAIEHGGNRSSTQYETYRKVPS